MRLAHTRNITELTSVMQGLNRGVGPRLRHEQVHLSVSRENIVQDTISQIERIIYTDSAGPQALRRPLLVKFQGEEARDANIASEAGVRREFFMLLLHNLLDPKYGMIQEWIFI
jgi:hypothetical protein